MVISVNKACPTFTSLHKCYWSKDLCRLITWEVHFYLKIMKIFGYSFDIALRPVGSALRPVGSALRPVGSVTAQPLCGALTGFLFVARVLFYYAIHGGPYTSTHVPIENTLVQHKMVKNSCMALCCQNQEFRGTGWRYGLYSSASIFVHSAHVTVLGLLEKKTTKEKK